MAAIMVVLPIAGPFVSQADLLAVRPRSRVGEVVVAVLYVAKAGRHTGLCGGTLWRQWWGGTDCVRLTS
ncbi:hypothetical protein DSM43518_05632 [Mycobacterium marinum]|nr:hypothetical protein DSM43518_05632 [Mycobacterium marinum]